MVENINPFSTNVPLLHPLKTSENLWFSDVFSGYKIGTLVENGLNTVSEIEFVLMRLNMSTNQFEMPLFRFFYKENYLNFIKNIFKNISEKAKYTMQRKIFEI